MEGRSTVARRARHAGVHRQLQRGGRQKDRAANRRCWRCCSVFRRAPNFNRISPRTRRDYIKQIKRIERAFGDFPIKALDDPRARSVFLEWRDQLAQTSLRQADYAYGTLARILSWAHNRRLIAKNPCAKGGKLYHGTRVHKIWDDEEVARFLRTAPPYLRLAMLLAINTGQRQGDLLRLPWSAYDGKAIKLRQRKTGAYVPIPVTDELKAALDAAPRQSPIMLTNSEGKPWSESGFQGAWGKATMRAGIRGLTFHDLRGTAVVTLARADCNEVEIYSITGHKPSDVRAILTAHYLPRDAEVAGNAIAKLNRYKKRGEIKAHVVAVQLDQVEGVEKHGAVVAAIADAIELGDAALVARDRLAVDDAGP